MKLIIFLSLIVISHTQKDFEEPTAARINEIKAAIKAKLSAQPSIHPAALRLAFHDCVGSECDGCINLSNPANKGLENVITGLDSIYNGNFDNEADGVSRADFWHLAGIVAVEHGIEINNEACHGAHDCHMPAANITFKWGRGDCDTSPSTTEDHEFPTGAMSRADMMDYFQRYFGFNENEVTALLGAHALGKASTKNSGYDGTWTQAPASFNNRFYWHLSKQGNHYKNEAVAPGSNDDKKWQWAIMNPQREKIGMLLNTDVELGYDIDVDPLSGTSCDLKSSCKSVPTLDLVHLYANNPARFLEDFSKIFVKMGENGQGEGDLQPIT